MLLRFGDVLRCCVLLSPTNGRSVEPEKEHLQSCSLVVLVPSFADVLCCCVVFSTVLCAVAVN